MALVDNVYDQIIDLSQRETTIIPPKFFGDFDLTGSADCWTGTARRYGTANRNTSGNTRCRAGSPTGNPHSNPAASCTHSSTTSKEFHSNSI